MNLLKRPQPLQDDGDVSLGLESLLGGCVQVIELLLVVIDLREALQPLQECIELSVELLALHPDKVQGVLILKGISLFGKLIQCLLHRDETECWVPRPHSLLDPLQLFRELSVLSLLLLLQLSLLHPKMLYARVIHKFYGLPNFLTLKLR